jgi:hypothetical protein
MPTIPPDFKTTNGFPMYDVTLILEQGKPLQATAHRFTVQTRGVRPCDGCDFVGGSHSLSSKYVFGIGKIEASPQPERWGRVKVMAYCAEADLDECLEEMMKVMTEEYNGTLSRLERQLRDWEACKLSDPKTLLKEGDVYAAG